MIKKGITKSHGIGWSFYKEKLSEKEVECYNLLLDGFMKYEQSIPYKNLEVKQIERIYEALKFDVPQLFFVKRITCQHMPILRCGWVVPQYRFSKVETYATLDAIQCKIDEIQKNVAYKSKYEKEKFIHDYICSSVKYDYTFKESSFECVGPILFGKGVCEGISKATKLLLDSVGIDSLIVHGASKNQQVHNLSDNSHAWNMVRIDNLNYHLDVTFDLSVMAHDVLRYDYFNLSNQDILIDHIYEHTAYPSCITSRDYYVEHNMYMVNKNLFKSYLETRLKYGEKNILVKLPRVSDIDKARDEIIDIVQKCISKRRISVQYQVTYNESQRVFLLHID